ncbi:MAG: LysM peptidoglycan-binding domain-containing protein [Oligoflexales bacterium]|nr:LysM peptidoglycan-binding domain-containing protein [Oligoflexales bacterium]
MTTDKIEIKILIFLHLLLLISCQSNSDIPETESELSNEANVQSSNEAENFNSSSENQGLNQSQGNNEILNESENPSSNEDFSENFSQNNAEFSQQQYNSQSNPFALQEVEDNTASANQNVSEQSVSNQSASDQFASNQSASIQTVPSQTTAEQSFNNTLEQEPFVNLESTDNSIDPTNNPANSVNELPTSNQLPATNNNIATTNAAPVLNETGVRINEFSGTPPLPGSIRELLEGEAPEEYYVQPGDTLYDICDQLLDEPSYWPKLWALNPDIKNPHFLQPGIKLRFYSGDLETPPYLEVVSKQEIPIVEEEMLPIILGEHIPSEIVELKDVNVIDSEDFQSDTEITSKIQFAGAEWLEKEINLRVPGFVFAQKQAELGFILNGIDGNSLIQDYAQAYIRFNSNLQAGQTYTVLRYSRPTENGHLYYYIANVSIDKLINQNQAMATVKDSRTGLLSGDIIVPYVSTLRRIDPAVVSSALSGANGASLLAFENEYQNIGSGGQMALLNKGTSNGVAVGQYYNIIQKQNRWLLMDETDNGSEENIGLLRIIDTTDVGAVAYILSSQKEVRIGDRIGGG